MNRDVDSAREDDDVLVDVDPRLGAWRILLGAVVAHDSGIHGSKLEAEPDTDLPFVASPSPGPVGRWVGPVNIEGTRRPDICGGASATDEQEQE